jgi:hypothetical protein
MASNSVSKAVKKYPGIPEADRKAVTQWRGFMISEGKKRVTDEQAYRSLLKMRKQIAAEQAKKQAEKEIIVAVEKRSNPIMQDTFDSSLNRALQFSSFLLSYAEMHAEDDCTLDGEVEGHAMAISLLHDALKQLNRLRDAETLTAAREAA